MTTAPLKVLLLGWDTPASSDAPVTSAATPELVSALAPHADLTLLLPHLSEPMRLASSVQATGLGNLSAEELARTEPALQAPRPETWQSPEAPYLGASVPGGAGGTFGGNGADGFQVPAAPYVGSSAGAEAPPTEAAPEAARQNAPEATSLLNQDDFAADTEPDTAEAEALSQPADDLHPDTPAAPVEAPHPAPEEFPAPSVRQSVLDVALTSLRNQPTDEAGLNFKVIQYARFATRMAAQQDFAVIYASDWQSWLAGMEIRQLTGKPLVLHVHSLAQDRTSAADRGWVLELERMALRRADLVLTASSALAMRVLELHDLPPQRVRRLSSSAAQDPAVLADTILAALREVSPE